MRYPVVTERYGRIEYSSVESKLPSAFDQLKAQFNLKRSKVRLRTMDQGQEFAWCHYWPEEAAC